MSEYPFQPKSTSFLEQGQFWAVPLKHGGFGCGVVLAKRATNGKIESRLFLAGLLDWFGQHEPTLKDIEGTKTIEKGYAHIKAISETGGKILGSGFVVLRTPKVVEQTDSIRTWGYNVISVLAEKHETVNKALHRTPALRALDFWESP